MRTSHGVKFLGGYKPKNEEWKLIEKIKKLVRGASPELIWAGEIKLILDRKYPIIQDK